MINIELFVDKENITEDDISEVAICLDNEGIEELCKKLQYLKMVTGPEHIHLATEQWGGAGLSDKQRNVLKGRYEPSQSGLLLYVHYHRGDSGR